MADELTIDLSLAGKSLVGLGRAKCRVAAMQASFLDELQETYLAGLGEDCKSLLRSASKLRSTAPFPDRALEQTKDYAALRKKLDSRR